MMGIIDRCTPQFVKVIRDEFKASGFKGVYKRFGWKLFAAFFMYYLIRDSFLYIFLPWYIATRLQQ